MAEFVDAEGLGGLGRSGVNSVGRCIEEGVEFECLGVREEWKYLVVKLVESRVYNGLMLLIWYC